MNLTSAMNAMNKEVSKYQAAGLLEKVLHNYYMSHVLAEAICAADSFPILTQESFKNLCLEKQLKTSGFKDKEGESPVAEEGDDIILEFEIYDGDELVANSEGVVVYRVGSKGFSFGENFVGMAIAEKRIFDVSFSDEKIVKKEHVGKNLRMLSVCRSIKQQSV